MLAVAAGAVALAGCDALAPAVESPRGSPPPVTSPGPVAGGGAGDAASGIDAPLEALRNHEPTALQVGRNPFRFGPTAGGRRRGAAAAQPASGGGSVSERGELMPAAGTTPELPAPERADAIRFIGIVEARSRVGRVAVLADGDGVYHGLANEVVKGRYRILAITGTSLAVEDMALGTRITLRLSGT